MSLKRLLNPWIADNFRRMVNFKHKLFKQYKNRIIAFETYNNYKFNLQRKMKRAKRDYFVRRLNNCKNNEKKTWKIVNSVLSKPNRNKNVQLFWTVVVLMPRFMILGMSLMCVCACDLFSTIADKLGREILRTVSGHFGRGH